MDFVLSELCDQVMTARAGHKPLFVMGGGSKRFYGNYRPVRPQDGHCLLDMTPYRGIVSYHPSELVVTARAGTPLAELEAALAENGQMLAFEPPHFAHSATVGGCVAAGLSGPRRMSAGALRDFVLGAQLLDSEGRILSFGGEVMKNVAGYDVSRLLAGSHGIFGAILEVSLKVVPRPMEELTLCLPATEAQALANFAFWRGKPLPISATSWTGADGGEGMTSVRLSGAPPALESARRVIGGDPLLPDEAEAWWRSLREQTHAFFAPNQPLWRLALPPTAAALGLGPTLLEWGGGQRWLSGPRDAAELREVAARLGGHATLFRTGHAKPPADGVFHPLAPGVGAITRRLKQELDPAGLFNPGRLVLEL
ncbi:glycolate oxidase subunit GlcE [Achromobacter arsenitoxydans]|uniref:Glycolate oxidase FAD binding subunit n=1 Tax=Achromobacter arsenitoxydans SY8 TaxID=477184 RepID=H0F992_9BURK|nr:glycolate oxidase subunit GlcE [Achromobacter arsenitoxydans]EHK65157.1 glycolate oxidase FAD binding subunit [Achromobacter arsenitoxydans SY8]